MRFTLVSILPTENNLNSFYRVKVECLENCFSIIIFHNNTAYKGEITAEYVSNQSNIFNLSLNEYLEECRKAFQNSTSRQFTYSIADDHFHIKKSVTTSSANSIKVKFISVKLDKVDFQESILAVLDVTLNENIRFFEKVEELQSVNKSLKEGNELLLEQLKHLESVKNQMENALYFRFLNLLNSKKKKIKELKRNSGLEMEEDTASENEEEMPLQDYATNVYDADTDVDEDIGPEVVTNELKIEESASKNELFNEKPVQQAKEEFLNSNENLKDKPNRSKSKPMSIFDEMSILDPTIPFVG